MIASTPVRLVSLMILAAVIVVGIRGIFSGIFSGIALGGDLGGNLLDDHSHGGRDTGPSAPGPGSTAQRTRGSVAYVLDGDTVQVTTRSGRSVRVRFLGIIH